MPLSTVEPVPVRSHHYKVSKRSLPMTNNFQSRDSWVKGDMLYTVGFHRLDLVRLDEKRPDGKRKYFQNRLDKEQMKTIHQCVLHGLNLGSLAQYL